MLRGVMIGLVSLAMTGCWKSSSSQVVVYTALDSEFSAPIFASYEDTHDVQVLAQYDTESTKTVGLTEKLIAERDKPRCDVFWNNEILNTIRLKRMGLLDEYNSSAAKRYPQQFRSPTGAWYGFAARGRVLVVNTDTVPVAEFPRSIRDLAQDKWRGQGAIAKPLFGTTATHAACLFAKLGGEDARTFFESMKSNEVQVLSGNKEVARSVAAGRAKFGLTDTDDAIVEIEHGMPIAIVYPDQEDDGLGTLFIPNTVSILRGAPHPQAARDLVDYLLSSDVEAKLAAGPSAQIPLRSDAQSDVRIETPRTVKAMDIDFEDAADAWDEAASFLRDQFAGSN